MRVYLLFLLLIIVLVNYQTNAQTNPLLISTNGVDSIKLGMSKLQVENIVKSKLIPYSTFDSIIKNQDTTLMKNACNNCSEYLICNYKGVEFVLTFFRNIMSQKHDFKLVGISPTSELPVIETDTGIKVGMKENKFIKICKKNKYPYYFSNIDNKNKGYLFADNLNNESSNLLMIKVSSGIITYLSVIDMSGE